MAFEITGTVVAEEIAASLAAETITAEAAGVAMEAMPLAFDSFASMAGTFEGAGFALPEAFGGAAASGTSAAAAAAPTVAEGSIGAGEGITAATPNALETGAALPPPEAPPVSPYTPVGDSSGIMNVSNTGGTDLSNAFAQHPGQLLTDSGEWIADPNAAVSSATPTGTTPTGLNPTLQGNAALPNTTPGADSVLSAPQVSAPPSAPTTPYGTLQAPTTPGSLAAPEGNAFTQGLKAVGDFAGNHEFLTGAGLYLGANAAGLLNNKQQTFGNQNQTSFNNPYHYSSDFQGSHPDPKQYQYTPKYAAGGITQIGQNNQPNLDVAGGGAYPMSQQQTPHYATPSQMPTSAQAAMASYEPNTNPLTGEQTSFASGGITGFARGGQPDTYAQSQRFLDMYDPASHRQAPPVMSDVGIIQDTSPSTKYQDALTASQTRMGAINKKAGINMAAPQKPSFQMGQLNMQPANIKQTATADNSDQILGAAGGIMHANLGGYATGGMPRLLKGPGDGMSDDIPAQIGAKQPARLADGEFVVPADVVSGLGNGSTDAGAKRLHAMMDKVRVARTGTKQQGKKIKADKYLP